MGRTVTALALVALVAGCSGGEESLSSERDASVSSVVDDLAGESSESVTDEDLSGVTDRVAQAPDCDELQSPVDVGVLDTGCFVGEEWALAVSMDCGDGTEVIVVGEARAGVVGGEWVEVDPETGPWSLCP